MLKEEKQAIMAEWSSYDGWSEKKPSRLPQEGRHREIPFNYRKTRYP